MLHLNTYINEIGDKVSSIKRTRKSKVEEALYNEVVKRVEAREPNTIKQLCEILNKRPQHLHQIIKKSDRLTKIKVKGLSIVVPQEQEATE